MAWRDLFVYRARPTRERTKAGGGEPPAGGAFITPQTLTSFAGASTIIGIATRIYLALAPNANGHVVAAIAAVVMGIIVFAINVTDPQAKPSDGRSWFIASIVGIVNILYLVAVALGVFEALEGTNSSGGTGGTNT
jgi:hypothetical protein